MNDNSTKHIRVLKSQGVLTPRVEAIIRHYESHGVDVRQTIEREQHRLEDKLVLMECFGEENEHTNPNHESTTFVRAKINACKDILSVINS